MNQNKIIREFQEHLLEKHQLQPVTVERYICDLRLFFSFLAESGIREIREVNSGHIKKYRKKLISGKLSGLVKGSRLRIVQKLFNYLTETNQLLINPTQGIEFIPVNRKAKEVLTQKEITRLLKQPDQSTKEGFRNYLILELLLATGLRLKELLSLNVYDLDFNKGILYIWNNTTKRTRSIPLPENVIKLLSRYIEEIRPLKNKLNPEERTLILSSRGNRLGRLGIHFVMSKYRKKAGITKQVSCTTLRRYFALKRLKEKMNIEDVSKLMGNQNTRATYENYIFYQGKK